MEKTTATNEKKIRWGLALGGGGSRGSYTIGVIKALAQCGYHFDAVTGVSIGALAGAGYTMQTDKGLDEWISAFKEDMVVDRPFQFPNRNNTPVLKPDQGAEFIEEFTQGGPSIEPLIKAYSDYFSFKDFKDSPVDFACLTYNVTQNKPVVFYKKDMTEEDCILKLMSSTAYFPAFNLVSLNGDQYADGSYCEVPLGQEIQKMNVDKVIAVELHNAEENALKIAPGVSLVIKPILNLRYFLDFRPDDLKKQIAQGYLEGLKYLNQAPGYVYTFYKEDAFAFRTLTKLTDEVMKKAGVTLNNEMLIHGISELLGYQPGVLDNKLMPDYTAGLIFECLGLIAGMSPYQQYHMLDFAGEILNHLNTGQINPQPYSGAASGTQMEIDGARDLLIFFHSGLKSFDGKLPPQFDCFKKKFASLYYLALAWCILEKFSGVFNLAEKFHSLRSRF